MNTQARQASSQGVPVDLGASTLPGAATYNHATVRHMDLRAATRALVVVRARTALNALEYRLLPLVEACLAVPGACLHDIRSVVEDVRENTVGYLAKRALFHVLQALLHAENLVLDVRILLAERKNSLLGRNALILEEQYRLFRRREFLLLVGGKEAADALYEVEKLRGGPDGRVEIIKDVHGVPKVSGGDEAAAEFRGARG